MESILKLIKACREQGITYSVSDMIRLIKIYSQTKRLGLDFGTLDEVIVRRMIEEVRWTRDVYLARALVTTIWTTIGNVHADIEPSDIQKEVIL